jgi:hypothetical protein
LKTQIRYPLYKWPSFDPTHRNRSLYEVNLSVITPIWIFTLNLYCIWYSSSQQGASDHVSTFDTTGSTISSRTTVTTPIEVPRIMPSIHSLSALYTGAPRCQTHNKQMLKRPLQKIHASSHNCKISIIYWYNKLCLIVHMN